MRIRHLGSDRGDIEYIYDDKSIIDEVQNGTSTQVAHYRYGDRLLSLNTEGAEQFYHYASLGTTANLSNSAGENQIAYRVDPFGAITKQEGASVNRQVFTGHEHDEETGLIYMKARFYDPDVGRFLNQDTYLGENGTPPSLHRYLYGYSNPTYWVDPTGNYNEGGHYYTTMIVAMRSGYSPEESATLAMYAQIPDEVASYDAISLVGQVVTHSLKDGLSGGMEASRRLHRYQEGMHQLNGRDSEKATAAAISTIRGADRNDLAKIGLAIHPLGDSFSHRKMGDENVTYVAPLGHGEDGTAPDTIHLRKGIFHGYVETLANVLAEKNGMKLTEENMRGLQGDLWKAVEASKIYEGQVKREYIPSVGDFMDIHYPPYSVNDAATNMNTIIHLRKLAIKEYAKHANISLEEAEKRILVPEDNSTGVAHGVFRTGFGEEVDDVEGFLETRPSDKNWLKRWWDGDEKKEAQEIWKELDPKAGEVADEIIEKVQ